MKFKESKCIGCGCTDSRACIEPESGNPCSWLRVDRHSGLGVCSCCTEHVQSWDEGHESEETRPKLMQINFDDKCLVAELSDVFTRFTGKDVTVNVVDVNAGEYSYDVSINVDPS